MTLLRFEKISIPSANLGGESSLPALTIPLGGMHTKPRTDLPEEDGLFIGYGGINYAFPYKDQDTYGRELTDTEYDAAILENDNIKATFLPRLGGKLISLFDKSEGKELLFRNEVIRPGNLAVRNGWTSGGVEWNMGFLGHSPMTMSLVNTARCELPDGTPVLRFYWYERIRRAIAQIDAFLPEGAKMLHIRTRITNPNLDVIPMYWWSNIAAVQEDGARVIVPADETYLSIDNVYTTTKIPEFMGVDVTYPLKSKTAYDYFWKTRRDGLRYICQLNKDGYGLATASTGNLLGRKLFVWGDTPGGARWQNFLTKDDLSGSYNEIQVGLARTQLECVPMPPLTVWEWLEVYGPMQADSKSVHGSWMDAKQEVEGILGATVSEKYLEDTLNKTRTMAKSPATAVFKNEGWASLELMRRKKENERDLMCPHLEFENPGEEQAVWISLMECGTVGEHDPKDVPLSYQLDAEWLDMLHRAIEGKDAKNWYAYYLLASAEAALNNYREAKSLIEKSLELKQSAWAYYVLGVAEKAAGNENGYVDNMLKAYALRGDDVSLSKDVFKALYSTKRWEILVSLFENAASSVKSNERCLLYYAYALAMCDRTDETEKIIINDGKYLIVPDIREAETLTSDLWYLIHERRGIKKRDIPAPPRALDFRMSYNLGEVKDDE